MQGEIIINLNNCSGYDIDTLTFAIRQNIETVIADFNRLNPSSQLSFENIKYRVPDFTMKPIKQQIEEKSVEIYPTSTDKKANRDNKKARQAYIKGCEDTLQLQSSLLNEKNVMAEQILS